MAEPRQQSIFAQRMQKRRERTEIKRTEISNINMVKNFGDKSNIVTGKDGASIHKENVLKLLNMSEEEIIQEREKLIAEMDPTLVKYLQSRRQETESCNVKVNLNENVNEDSKTSNSSSKMEVDNVAQVTELANKYPHMDVIEEEKLQWIGELPVELNVPKDPYPARFNFEGKLLPYSDKGEGVLQGLHNHGEDQERPGYSLQELIQLSRSAVLQQRVIAINTLAKVMANASSYDECFDTPLIATLLEADTFLLLRFTLDDTSQPVVSASAVAICNLLVNHLDELCLDLLLGTPLGLEQPSFGVELDMSEDEVAELKDHELLKLDIVRGALRTDLLRRMKYILSDLSIEPVELKSMLKTITRIARHSNESAEMVFECPGLLTHVRSLMDRGQEGSYFPEALKLFRILSAHSRSFAEIVAVKYNVLDAVFRFISGEKAVNHPETMQLTLQSFYMWQTFLSYNMFVDKIGELTPVLFRFFGAHFGLTNLNGSNSDLEHGTALVSTLSCAAKFQTGIIHDAIPVMLQVTQKWLVQYEKGLAYSFQASKLVGASLNFFTFICSEYKDCNIHLLPILDRILKKSCFTMAVQRLRKHSWLIRGKIIFCPDNLPCLGSTPPTLQDNSSLPFIVSLTSYLLKINNTDLTECCVINEEIINYIENILKGDNVRLLSGHWYARQEILLLVNLVQLYTSTQISENEKLYHKLAFTLLTSIQSGDKYLLSDLMSKTIFNSKFFRADVEAISIKMNDIQLHSKVELNKNDILVKALQDIRLIEDCYIGEFGLQYFVQPHQPVSLTGVLNSTQCALPSDWIFIPILKIYNIHNDEEKKLKRKKEKLKESKCVEITTRCLEWFIIMEELLSEFSCSLSATAKYCRLCCVYLADNDLFRDVTPLLELALQYTLKNRLLLNFESSIPGLTSFYDFYRDLLEQFAFSSFCDRVFGQYILVPLAQQHDRKYKKLVWSEMNVIIRSLRTPIIYVNMENYFEPLETDAQMLDIYLYGLKSGLVKDDWCPVLYNIAVHHVSRYIKEKTDHVADKLRSQINTIGIKPLQTLLLGVTSLSESQS